MTERDVEIIRFYGQQYDKQVLRAEKAEAEVARLAALNRGFMEKCQRGRLALKAEVERLRQRIKELEAQSAENPAACVPVVEPRSE